MSEIELINNSVEYLNCKTSLMRNIKRFHLQNFISYQNNFAVASKNMLMLIPHTTVTFDNRVVSYNGCGDVLSYNLLNTAMVTQRVGILKPKCLRFIELEETVEYLKKLLNDPTIKIHIQYDIEDNNKFFYSSSIYNYCNLLPGFKKYIKHCACLLDLIEIVQKKYNRFSYNTTGKPVKTKDFFIPHYEFIYLTTEKKTKFKELNILIKKLAMYIFRNTIMHNLNITKIVYDGINKYFPENIHSNYMFKALVLSDIIKRIRNSHSYHHLQFNSWENSVDFKKLFNNDFDTSAYQNVNSVIYKKFQPKLSLQIENLKQQYLSYKVKDVDNIDFLKTNIEQYIQKLSKIISYE